MDHKITVVNSLNLDLIRIIAAFSVLIGHLLSFFGYTVLKDETYFPYIQSLAVNVFFILSGFLTDFSLCRKDKNYKYVEYVIERFCRIFTFLLPCILFIGIIDIWSIFLNSADYPYYETFNIITLIKNVTLMPGLSFVPIGTARPLWTLYIEWALYMVYGYIYLVLRKNSKSKPSSVFHMGIVLLIFVAFHLQNSLMQVFAFVCGIVINRIYKKIHIRFKYLLLGVSIVLFLIVSLYFKTAYCLQEIAVIALVILIVLVIGEYSKISASKKVRDSARFIAGMTYPLYLTHYTISLFIINTNLFKTRLANFWGSLILSLIIATVLFIVLKDVGSKLNKKILRRMNP